MPTKKEEILNQRYIISNDTLNSFRGTPSKIRFEKVVYIFFRYIVGRKLEYP